MQNTDREIIRFGIVSFKFNASEYPVMRHLCSYLAEKYGYPIDTLVDGIAKPIDYSNKEMNLINLLPPSFYNYSFSMKNVIFLWRIIYRTKQFYFSVKKKINSYLTKIRLKYMINKYDFIFCIEAYSLVALEKINFNFRKVIYISLESTQAFNSDLELLKYKYLLEECRYCIIQSKERAEDFERELGVKTRIKFLPVSMRPINCINKRVTFTNRKAQLVHTGYLAEWTHLKDFLNIYLSEQNIDNPLHIHNYTEGEHSYYLDIMRLVRGNPSIKVDISYMDERNHHLFLSKMDIGLAFYKNVDKSINMNNMFFSSQKIAKYLWSGLAIMTNIESEYTSQPPFLKINNFTKEEICSAVKKYEKEPQRYYDSALELSNQLFNLDSYMEKITYDCIKE